MASVFCARCTMLINVINLMDFTLPLLKISFSSKHLAYTPKYTSIYYFFNKERIIENILVVFAFITESSLYQIGDVNS